MHVSWKIPSQPNGIITQFQLQYHVTNSNQTVTISIIGVTHILSGLASDTEYQFTVRAFTRVGASPWSDVVISHTGE